MMGRVFGTPEESMIRCLTPLLALLAFQSSARADNPAAPKKYNIVFLFADDQRADTVAALGNKHIRTPNLDRLVHEGTAFTRAYCMGSPKHGAVCVPSRAMLLTGRTMFRVDETLKQPTWPEAFARAGYVTFVTGKWHNGQASALRCFQQGNSIFFGGMGNPDDLPVADFTTEHTLTKAHKAPKHSVSQFADSAIEFLRSYKEDKPFVAYVPFNGPHDPRTAPKEYHDYYNANLPPLPPNYLAQHPFNNGELVVRDEQLAPWPRTPEVVRQHLADYYAYITFLDEQVGRIVAALKETGRYDNTIIVFTADHGLAIGSHGLFGKQNLYDHSMHAPLIMAGPGIPKDQRSDALLYLLDLFPTLGELTGVTGPEGSEGVSVAPVLHGKASTVRESLFFAYRNLQRAVMDARWHLIVYPQINKTQLFDLQADPHELKDRAGDSMYADEMKRLTKLLIAWQQKVGDTQPLTTENPQPLEFDFSKVKTKKSAALPQKLHNFVETGAPAGYRAGLGKVDITPQGPVWMAGYGNRNKPSQGVDQPLHARALAVQDGSDPPLVLVSADIIGFSRAIAEDIAEKLAQKHKLPRANLMLVATHTHTGPVIGRNLTGMFELKGEDAEAVERYADLLVQRVVEAASAALADLQPAQLSFGRGQAHFAVNRRVFKGGNVNFGVNPDGPVDLDVPVLRVDDPKGKVRAVVFGYACHCTTLGGDTYQISGDWAGFAQEYLERAHPGATALFVTGCGADANPEPRGKLDFAREHGLEIAGAVSRVLSVPGMPVTGKLQAALERVELPLAPPPTRAEFEKRLQDKNAFLRLHARRHLDKLERGEKLPTGYPCPVQLWQFGKDLTLVALGGEVVVDYALRLKRELKGGNVWMAAYANDVFAYVPSARILLEGGYEADFSMIYYGLPGRFAPEVEETLVRKVHALAKQVR
jgi:arylsulfatase A-like enzyme